MTRVQYLLEGALVLQCIFYVILCPYTKVEESFNLQAVHDLLYHRTDLEKYDHHEFPGVVPRSFIGPLVVAFASWPLVSLASSAGCSKFIGQYIVRCVLGTLVCLSFITLVRTVKGWLGSTVACFALLLTMVQFHFLFYASRTLPNTFALALAMICYRFWLLRQQNSFLIFSGVAILVFRIELAVLLGLFLLIDLVAGRINWWKCLLTCLAAGVVILGISILVDSYFWRRWLWTEGEVFWYNTYLNKSSNWGVSPFLWYFYSALPRACLIGVPLAVWGVIKERRTWPIISASLIFVLVYSLLPHKELRFIIYTIPLLNVTAAAGLTNLYNTYKKSVLPMHALITCVLVVSLAVSLVFLFVSTMNYPGGQAMYTLHHKVGRTELDKPQSVHIDITAAQTGVSRFTEIQYSWSYHKTEGLLPGSKEMKTFSFLVLSAHADISLYSETHTVLADIKGYGGIKFDVFPFVNLESKILILRKR